MMRKLLLILLVWVLAAIGNSALAQETQKIAAVVNDEVISLFDLQSRLSLLIAGADTRDTPEVRRRLAPEVLRRMIDEVLQLQEAKRLNIAVNDADIAQAMANIERQNGMPRGGLEAFLDTHGINRLTMVAQVEPQIAWSKVVNRRIRPQIQISPEEVSETLARIKASAGKPEYLLAEIFLRVDETENEAQISQAAQRIMQQLQQPGANFAAVARNFSQAPSAAEGGSLGWIRAEELGDDLADRISRMQPGQIVGPIRTLSGFQIVLLRDRRLAAGLPAGDVEVQLQQLFFPLAADAPTAQVNDAASRAQAFAARATNCADMESLAKELATPMSGSLGRLKTSSLPPAVRNAINGLDIGRPSGPVRNENGLAILMVCDRQGGQNAEQEQREQIERMLTLQRLDAA
ncbi:MAG: peptidylprolyl isomerase, partial [Rhodospirillales bacterium]|nr:peptidylprolyl isomerase [Rhodospirillales bacterium]